MNQYVLNTCFYIYRLCRSIIIKFNASMNNLLRFITFVLIVKLMWIKHIEYHITSKNTNVLIQIEQIVTFIILLSKDKLSILLTKNANYYGETMTSDKTPTGLSQKLCNSRTQHIGTLWISLTKDEITHEQISNIFLWIVKSNKTYGEWHTK